MPDVAEAAMSDMSFRHGGRQRAVVFMLGSLGDTLVCLPALREIRSEVGRNTEIWLAHEDQANGRVKPGEVLAGEGLCDGECTFPNRKGPRDIGGWLRFGRTVARLRARRVYALL